MNKWWVDEISFFLSVIFKFLDIKFLKGFFRGNVLVDNFEIYVFRNYFLRFVRFELNS